MTKDESRRQENTNAENRIREKEIFQKGRKVNGSNSRV